MSKDDNAIAFSVVTGAPRPALVLNSPVLPQREGPIC